MPEELKSTASFPRLGLPSTLIRYENGTCRKRSSYRRNLKTLVFRFRANRKDFENRALEKTMTSL